MSYVLSIPSFNRTFAVKEEDSKLRMTHNNGIRFKLLPYVTSSSVEACTDLSTVVGRYLAKIERKESVSLSMQELITRLRNDEELEIQLGTDEIFSQVVRHMFFDANGKIRPINLRMFLQISCKDKNETKLADYLVDVLGDQEHLRKTLEKALKKADAQSNALERFAASKFELKAPESSLKSEQHYQRITNALVENFEKDFEYILGARNRTRDYLVPLLEFYYFAYTAQMILQLNRFLDGDREKCIPLYFCLEWEKTSQNRQCFREGWNILQDAISRVFAHVIVLEILNQTEDETEPIDYIKLREFINCAPEEDHRIAEEIKKLTDYYRSIITDCSVMTELSRRQSQDGETVAEVKYLFDSVRLQFENTTQRNRPYNSYAKNFRDYCRKYLKSRGRSGMMLSISEEMLIFLTKISIKDQEKVRLNDIFTEFESRGVYLDDHSKSEVMQYYEKLNLIEKKSDSGDAQYVKRIL